MGNKFACKPSTKQEIPKDIGRAKHKRHSRGQFDPDLPQKALQVLSEGEEGNFKTTLKLDTLKQNQSQCPYSTKIAEFAFSNKSFEEESQKIYKQLSTLYTEDKNNFFITVNFGQICSIMDKDQEALKYFKEGLQIDQTNLEAWILKIEQESKMGLILEAFTSITEAHILMPNSKKLLDHRMEFLRDLGDLDNLIQIQQMSANLSQKANDFFNLGSLQCFAGEFEKAIESYKMAIKNDPNHFPALAEEAFALTSLSKFNEAVQICDKALLINENYQIAYVNKGSALYELKKLDLALQSFQDALKINKENPLVFSNLASIYIDKKEKKKALEACNDALHIDNKFVPAYHKKAMSLILLKQYQQAVQVCEIGLLIDADFQELYTAKAKAEQLMGRSADARASYLESTIIQEKNLSQIINEGKGSMNSMNSVECSPKRQSSRHQIHKSGTGMYMPGSPNPESKRNASISSLKRIVL